MTKAGCCFSYCIWGVSTSFTSLFVCWDDHPQDSGSVLSSRMPFESRLAHGFPFWKAVNHPVRVEHSRLIKAQLSINFCQGPGWSDSEFEKLPPLV